MKIQPIKPLPSIKIVGFPPIKPLPSIKDCFNNNKKHTIMENERKITAPEGCEIEKVELVDGAAVVTFREKERKLPKSWEEFCEMYPIKKNESVVSSADSSIFSTKEKNERDNEYDKCYLPDRTAAEAVLALCQLVQLRDCYNGDWVPNSKMIPKPFTIDFSDGEIRQTHYDHLQTTPLYFKTAELRDEFLRNFRDLIEKLKPLYGIREGGSDE